MSKLTKENTEVFQSEKGNLYISHPEFKVKLRFYADIAELTDGWRDRISLREGSDNSFYAVLAKSVLTKIDA